MALRLLKATWGNPMKPCKLEKLVVEKYGIMVYMKVEKRFIQFNNNPAYQRMLEKMGLQ